MKRADWWAWTAWGVLVLQAACRIVPEFKPGVAGAVSWMLGGDPIIWLGLAGLVGLVGVVWSAFRRPFWRASRLRGWGALVAACTMTLTYRHYPSTHADEVSGIRFRLPLNGVIRVGWGGDRLAGNYHVRHPDQRWAYDLLVVRDGASHRGLGAALEDYYCYGMDVVAPCDAVVHAIADGLRDEPPGRLSGSQSPCGNHVILEVSRSRYLFLCHLMPGSRTVNPGDRVTRGQLLAKVGNSGNTSEPHLHIHVQDTPDDMLGEGVPLYFWGYRAGGALVERGMPRGGVSESGWAGDEIEHVHEE